MRKTGTLIAIVVILMNLIGCRYIVAGTVGAVVGGAGTAMWLSGKLTQEVNASYERTINAANSALAALNMKVVKETRLKEVTQFKSQYIDGREVWIDIRPVTDTSTKIEVRVGAMGDKEASERILKEITSHL